jgi:GTPase
MSPALERPDDFDETLESFAGIQAQINHDRAQQTLRTMLEGTNLSQRERAQLAEELAELETWLGRLDRAAIQIAAFGMVGRGKSSILNALLGQEAFVTGALHGVTTKADWVTWQVAAWQDEWGLDLPTVVNEQVEFFDTPGIDEIRGSQHANIAWDVARQADLILFVVAGDVTAIERSAVQQLREVGKPMLLVFNKIDQYAELDRQAIYHKICTERVRELLSAEEVVMVAAAPLIDQVITQPNGQQQVVTERGAPQVAALKSKILQVLYQEGKSLVALNSMMAANRLEEKVISHKMTGRERIANDRIWQAVMAKSVAVALNPVTVLDLLAGAAIDVAMIINLSQIYDLPLTKQGAAQLFQTILLGMGGIATGEVLVTLGLSGLKGLLGIAAPVTGGLSIAPYTAVALAQATMAGVATYSIGQVAKTYLANGASWSDHSPKTVVKEILATIDEDSIMNRIKQELTHQLERPG